MKHPFDDEELLTLLESARVGMSDADNFDDLAKAHDLSDEYMVALREKLEKFMDEDPKRRSISARLFKLRS